MSFFSDFVKIFKKRDIALLESFKESDDAHTFLFKKDHDVSWVAGQHALITVTHEKIKTPLKPFTVASAPAENVVRLTMGIGKEPSEFKKAMLNLKPGMTVKLTGPVGGFQLKDNSPAVFIAGGIGITPFRSIIKQLEADNRLGSMPIHLLYMDSKKSYIFKDELDKLDSRSPLEVVYLDSREDLNREIDKLTGQYHNNAKYYISGPKGMVNSLSEYVQSQQVSKRNIVKDAFFGY